MHVLHGCIEKYAGQVKNMHMIYSDHDITIVVDMGYFSLYSTMQIR